MINRNSIFVMAAGISLWILMPGWILNAGAAPQSVTIQGTLEDGSGAALAGSRNYQVTFFDQAVAGTQLGGTLNGSTSVEDSGRFSFAVVLPDEALDATSVYYELGIDSAVPPDGTVDTADIFPDRIQVTSVPFARNAPPPVYEAIVSATGNGDFSTIQEALDAGAKTIFVRNGVYPLTAKIVIDGPGITIIGESAAGVILDAQLEHRYIQAQGEVRSEIGNVSINQDSTTVLGSGTAFLANVYPGDLIELPTHSGNVIEIATVVGDDGLTLKYPYRGEMLSGAQYRVFAPNYNIHLENLTVQNVRGTFVGGFNLVYLINGTIRNCRAVNCEPHGFRLSGCRNTVLDNNVGHHGEDGILIYSCRNMRLASNLTYNNSQYGIRVELSQNNILQGNTAFSNKWSGIAMFNNCHNNQLVGNMARQNGVDGIYVSNTSYYNTLTANQCSDNVRDGIRLDGNTDRNIVSSNICHGNNNYGINLSSPDGLNNVVSSNICYQNVVGDINNSGTGTILIGNYP